MEMRVIMCSDTPIHTIYSTKELALEKLDSLRKQHFVKSGCSQSMTFSTYKETHVWYFVETSWEVETNEQLLHEAIKTKEFEDACIDECADFDVDAFDKLAEAIANDKIEKELAAEPVVEIKMVDCPHKWQTGMVKGRYIAQCVHCLKTEVMTEKELKSKKQISFVKYSVGER